MHGFASKPVETAPSCAGTKASAQKITPSVLGNFGVDPVRPGQDAAFQVLSFSEAGLLQKLDRLGAASPAAAVDHHIFLLGGIRLGAGVSQVPEEALRPGGAVSLKCGLVRTFPDEPRI